MKRISYIVLAAAVVFVIVLSPRRGDPTLLERGKDFLAPDSCIDMITYFDANNILMFVTNVGSVGMDQGLYFARPEGFYYPFSGDTSDIRSGEESRTLLYAAGLIVVGRVDNDVHSAVCMYDQSEFVPGPAGNDSVLPQSFFSTFKIDENSTTGDYDYDNWPVAFGAPADTLGNPLLFGEQTLWSVFNDTDSNAHDWTYGGGTEPLGIEVQQTVWGSALENEENVLYVKYKIYNRGENDIDSLYIVLWADPDIGGPNDDLVGCDTTFNLIFCYNAADHDYYYDNIPPAWGIKVIAGPVVPSPGDTAWFDNHLLADHRNLGMSSFIHFANAAAPESPEELFHYAAGRDGQTGLPQTNPFTGDSTTYFASGNPLSHSGWIDENPADKKIMLGFGPLTFMPGDSQQVVLKVGACAERDRLMSLSVLRNILDENIPIDTLIDTLTYMAADSARVLVTDFGLQRVRFLPTKDQWLAGRDWGGNYFGGGVDYAGESFFGSGLNPASHPDSFCYAQIRFSNAETQKAYRYVRGADPHYGYFGYYDVPFTVWDLDRNRQLNAAFVEHVGSDVYDSTWWPDIMANNGGYEFLFIFNSDYSGDDPYDAAIPYPDYNILEDTDSMDVLYFAWTVLVEGYDISVLENGGTLDFVGQFINHNGIVDSLTFRKVDPGNLSWQDINLQSFAPGPSLFKITTSDLAAFQPSSDFIKFRDFSEARIAINFTPYHDGEYDEYLYIIDSVSGELLKAVRLIGGTWLPTHVDQRPEVIPSGFTLYQNYPNPFNSSTVIRFYLPARANVNVTVFNLLGRKVRTLINDVLPAGHHRILWDGTNSSGEQVSNGLYFYQMRSGEYSGSRKMLF